MSKEKSDQGESYVYIPPNSRLNMGNNFANRPTVAYEDRMKIINRDQINKQVSKLPKETQE